MQKSNCSKDPTKAVVARVVTRHIRLTSAIARRSTLIGNMTLGEHMTRHCKVGDILHLYPEGIKAISLGLPVFGLP